MDFLAGTNWADRRPSTNASLNLCERTTESAPNLHLLLLPAVCRKPTPTLPSSGAHLSRGDEIADDLNLVGRINPKGSGRVLLVLHTSTKANLSSLRLGDDAFPAVKRRAPRDFPAKKRLFRPVAS